MEVAARFTPASPDCAPGCAESISERPPFRFGSIKRSSWRSARLASWVRARFRESLANATCCPKKFPP